MTLQNKLEKGLSVQSSLAVSQCIGQRGETDGFRYRSNEEERSQEENVAGHDHDGTPRERERALVAMPKPWPRPAAFLTEDILKKRSDNLNRSFA